MYIKATTRRRGGIELDSINVFSNLQILANVLFQEFRNKRDAFITSLNKLNLLAAQENSYWAQNPTYTNDYRQNIIRDIDNLNNITLREFILAKRSFSFNIYFSEPDLILQSSFNSFTKLSYSQVVERLDAAGVVLTQRLNDL